MLRLNTLYKLSMNNISNKGDGCPGIPKWALNGNDTLSDI